MVFDKNLSTLLEIKKGIAMKTLFNLFARVSLLLFSVLFSSCDWNEEDVEKSDANFLFRKYTNSGLDVMKVSLNGENIIAVQNKLNQHGSLYVLRVRGTDTTALVYQNWVKPKGYGVPILFESEGLYINTVSDDIKDSDTLVIVFARWSSGFSEAVRQFFLGVGLNDWTKLSSSSSSYVLSKEKYGVGSNKQAVWEINPDQVGIRGVVAENGFIMFKNLSDGNIYEIKINFGSNSGLSNLIWSQEEIITGVRIFDKKLYITGHKGVLKREEINLYYNLK